MKKLVITLLIIVALLSASTIGYLCGRAYRVEVKESPIQSIDPESIKPSEEDDILYFIGEVEFQIVYPEED